MNKEQKQEAVKEIGEALEASSAVFAVDYRGISVPQAAELRSRLRDADASFSIVKNRLAKRITAEVGAETLDEHLVGPTALTYVHGDAVVAAKAITDFIKEHEILAYKGGIMDGEPLDAEQFSSISRLPGLDALRGQLVGMTAAPLTGVVRGLNGLLGGLASQLGQIAEQGLVGGDAAEAGSGDDGDDDEPEAPASDEPAGDDEPAVDAEPQTEEEKPEEPKSEASADEGGDPAPGAAGEPEVDAPAEDAGESDTPGGDAEVVPDADEAEGDSESEDETDTETKED